MNVHVCQQIEIRKHENLLKEAKTKSCTFYHPTIVSQSNIKKDIKDDEKLCTAQAQGHHQDSILNVVDKKREFINCKVIPPISKDSELKTTDEDCSSIKFQSDIWPINAHEQKENFFKFGTTPQFKLKGTISGIERLINHQNGKIKFNYFYEAKRILDLSLRKYKSLDKFVQYAFGKQISLKEAKEKVEKYLEENGVKNCINVIWTKHLICSAQMCTTRGKGRGRLREYTLLIKNNHENTFIRECGIECLLNHEIGTHYLRSYNDIQQVWSGNYLKYDIHPLKSHEGMKSEEGLACIHTIINAKVRLLCMPALLYYSACMAEYLSFKKLFDHLIRYVKNPEQRWKHCMRIKRILKSTSDIGGYGKDQRYFEGAIEILRNIDIIDFKTFFSGKIIWSDIPKITKLVKRQGLKYPYFMNDYDAYIRNLREIANINGIVNKPNFKFTRRSRKETINFLGLTEEKILKVYRACKVQAGGDSMNDAAKLCGCTLFSGIKYDIHLDLDENNDKTVKKRQIPIIFELEMRKPIIQ